MRILIFGDTPGVTQLLSFIPNEAVAGIVAASVRPQYFEELSRLADEIDTPFIVQPKWKSDEYNTFVSRIAELKADLIWVNSYSMIIREDVLDLSRLGAINIHAALLPRNRGCNPTQWEIINGDSETGVTLHEIDIGLDTGPIVDQIRIPLLFEDTWIDIQKKHIEATEHLIEKNLTAILSGSWQAKNQQESKATYNRRRHPLDGEFSWSESVVSIYNKIRALLPPLPPAYFINDDGKRYLFDTYRTIWEVTKHKYDSIISGKVIQADRICLRPLGKDDRPFLYEWISKNKIAIDNSFRHPIKETEFGDWIEQMMTESSDVVIFAIEESSSQRELGACQIYNIDWINRSAQLQIWIEVEDFYLKDFGNEVVKLLCKFGFEDLNLFRIYLNISASDDTAISTFKKIGFEGKVPQRKTASIDWEQLDLLTMSIEK
jgi:methionyl-tRNA formyltransferase